MQFHELCQELRERSKNGESYHKIGESLGITKPAVGRIIKGIRPGKKVSDILKLDPSPDLSYTRRRRNKLNWIAKTWGYDNWANYETCVLHTGNIEE